MDTTSYDVLINMRTSLDNNVLQQRVEVPVQACKNLIITQSVYL